MSEVVWNKYSKEEFEDVMKFSEGYIDFLSDSKTERACVKNAIASKQRISSAQYVSLYAM